MKRVFFILLCLQVIFSSSGQAQELGVMTFNIRYDNPSDNEFSWSNRRPMVYTVLDEYKPEIIGFQEALKGQVDQLQLFLKGYKHEGVGRDDGREAGEFSVLFYDSLRFVKKDGGTFWLSETPEIPGTKSWNAACNRVVTWINLFDKEANEILFVFNTHFDHLSEQARVESAKLLLKQINQITGKVTVIITGDFNSTDTSQVYQHLTDSSIQNSFNDTRKLAGENALGPDYSFVGFPFNPLKHEIIDFIFVSKRSNLTILQNRNIDYHLKGKYPSDHLPVLTKFKYELKK